jgi:hypothetical protein
VPSLRPRLAISLALGFLLALGALVGFAPAGALDKPRAPPQDEGGPVPPRFVPPHVEASQETAAPTGGSGGSSDVPGAAPTTSGDGEPPAPPDSQPDPEPQPEPEPEPGEEPEEDGWTYVYVQFGAKGSVDA